MLLIAAGYTGSADPVPTWVVVACYVTIGLGTMFGGWRIVRTMGQRITKIRPVGGFCAELSGSVALFLATALGIPVSTTHHDHRLSSWVLAPCRSVSAVRWGVAGDLLWAWILTIPCSAFIAAIAWGIARAVLFLVHLMPARAQRADLQLHLHLGPPSRSAASAALSHLPSAAP